MKESEAKKKQCPHVSVGTMVSMTLVKMFGDPTKEQIEQIAYAGLCSGSECVMWERFDERVEKITETTPNMDDCIPDGDNWKIDTSFFHKQGTQMTGWYRWQPSDSGDCGLKTKECNYPG